MRLSHLVRLCVRSSHSLSRPRVLWAARSRPGWCQDRRRSRPATSVLRAEAQGGRGLHRLRQEPVSVCGRGSVLDVRRRRRYGARTRSRGASCRRGRCRRRHRCASRNGSTTSRLWLPGGPAGHAVLDGDGCRAASVRNGSVCRARRRRDEGEDGRRESRARSCFSSTCRARWIDGQAQAREAGTGNVLTDNLVAKDAVSIVTYAGR